MRGLLKDTTHYTPEKPFVNQKNGLCHKTWHYAFRKNHSAVS